jgi:hypothetical protein
MLCVVMLSVIMLNVTYKPFMLSVILLSDVMLNVVMLIVMAPFKKTESDKHSSLLQDGTKSFRVQMPRACIRKLNTAVIHSIA